MSIRDVVTSIFVAVFLGVVLSLTIVLAAGDYDSPASRALQGMIAAFAVGAIGIGLAARFCGKSRQRGG